MDYHVWSSRTRNIFLDAIKHLKSNKEDYMVQGYDLEDGSSFARVV